MLKRYQQRSAPDRSAGGSSLLLLCCCMLAGQGKGSSPGCCTEDHSHHQHGLLPTGEPSGTHEPLTQACLWHSIPHNLLPGAAVGSTQRSQPTAAQLRQPSSQEQHRYEEGQSFGDQGLIDVQCAEIGHGAHLCWRHSLLAASKPAGDESYPGDQSPSVAVNNWQSPAVQYLHHHAWWVCWDCLLCSKGCLLTRMFLLPACRSSAS